MNGHCQAFDIALMVEGKNVDVDDGSDRDMLKRIIWFSGLEGNQ